MSTDAHYAPGGERNDRTARAVVDQLAAMACPQYDVGVFDGQAKRMMPRVLSADGVMASLPWLKHRNANGADVYIRPSGSTGLLLVDDVTPAAMRRLDADGLIPSVIVETSPGNLQAWIRLASSPIAPAIVTAAARELARCYGADLAAAKHRQYGRLAGFTNRKPRHRQADGRYPFVLLAWAVACVAPAAAVFLAAVESSTPHPPTAPAPAAPFSPPRGRIVCVLVDEYRRAVDEHCQRYHVDDWSRLDWMVTHDLAVAHPEATAGELAAAIAAASPRVQERHPGRVDQYALHTASKVLGVLNPR